MVRLRQEAPYIYALHISFQFLMVRLRRCGTVRMLFFLRISIPYGTIKTMEALARIAKLRAFQFLMVRLRQSERIVDGSKSIFQFLMVRLRQAVSTSTRFSLEISIPYGTIKTHWVAGRQ